ncbi:hypothetical protein D5086_016504 [Populus alba]|uniref:Uncharacterized protein n=3 Tax=Populus TaxID=3689 RepID=A0A4U5NQ66_POPAL|nr:uncharacterized protein LOC118040041 [Populus alba]KAJ6988099.1 hypothetical protein NC653_021123 [Populus alba x Populus x berolinensis]TKR84903.1 hypothetical protein D5086_0000252560 [Populus alba]
MPTLQKFKLLATQCGVAQGPTRGPRTSTAVHLRQCRKTTLRTLLGIRSPRRQEPPIHHRRSVAPLPERKRDTLNSNWFISATAFDEELERRRSGAERGDVIGGFGGECVE